MADTYLGHKMLRFRCLKCQSQVLRCIPVEHEVALCPYPKSTPQGTNVAPTEKIRRWQHPLLAEEPGAWRLAHHPNLKEHQRAPSATQCQQMLALTRAHASRASPRSKELHADAHKEQCWSGKHLNHEGAQTHVHVPGPPRLTHDRLMNSSRATKASMRSVEWTKEPEHLVQQTQGTWTRRSFGNAAVSAPCEQAMVAQVRKSYRSLRAPEQLAVPPNHLIWLRSSATRLMLHFELASEHPPRKEAHRLQAQTLRRC